MPYRTLFATLFFLAASGPALLVHAQPDPQQHLIAADKALLDALAGPGLASNL